MSEISLASAISTRRSCRAFDNRAVSSSALHNLLWAAQRQADEQGNRAVPSAQARHPLRLLITVGHLEGKSGGAYTVTSDAKSLTQIIDHDVRSELEKAVLDDQP